MTTSLTIAVDASRAFAAHMTGTERYATELIRHLVPLGGHRYRLYFRTSPVEFPPTAAAVDVRVIPCPRLWTHIRLAAAMFIATPDLLFVPAHVLPVVLPFNLPTVVTIHDVGYLHFPEAHGRFQRWYLDWTTRRHVRVATRMIAVSETTRSELIRHYGADPSRVSVIHHAVEDGFRPALASEVAKVVESLKLPAGAPYFLFVGTHQPRKNLLRLLDAFAIVVGDRATTLGANFGSAAPYLVLAGMPGWGNQDLHSAALALGVADQVRLAGYVARPDLAALYSGATAFVMPSLYEGFGMPVLEAMAYGVPVAHSNTSSLPEIAGGAGLSFDPTDVDAMARVMARLLTDVPLRSRLQAAGLARARQFTWARAATETLAVLESAAADRQARATVGRGR